MGFNQVQTLQEEDYFNISQKENKLNEDSKFDLDIKQNNGEKEKIRVFVMVGPKTSGIVTSYKDVLGKRVYSGFAWDVFKEITQLEQIKNKYDFEFIFSEFGKNNYNQSIQDIGAGKYDIGLGMYIHTMERENLINYTSPIAIDATAVFHYSNFNVWDTFKDVFSKVSYLFVLLIAFGVITGSMLYIFNPNRIKFTRVKGKKEFFIRSVITGISTFIGEMGYISENSTNTLKGVVIVTIVMLLAFIYILFLQAEVTSEIIKRKTTRGLDKEYLAEKPILAHDGYAMAEKIKEHGGILETHKGKSNKELFDMYKAEPDKYNGVALGYCDGFPYIQKINNLHATIDFGFEPISIPMTQHNPILNEDINKALLYIRSTGTLQKLCFSYFGDIPNIPVCTLN